MMDITYELGKLSDSHRLSILLQTVYIQSYAEKGITFEFSNFITKRFSTEYLEGIIRDDPNRLLVAYYKGNPIGVAEIIYDATCPIGKISMPDLSKLYVLNRFKGMGIGYQLNSLVIQKLRELNYSELFLEVWIKNLEAFAFYKRQGYITIGQVDCPMEFNTYVNIVMTKDLRSNNSFYGMKN